MARRLRKHYGATPTDALCRDVTAETLWRDTCGSALARLLRKFSDETLRLRCGGTPAQALWRDTYGSAMTRRLRRRYGASSAEGLWSEAYESAMSR